MSAERAVKRPFPSLLDGEWFIRKSAAVYAGRSKTLHRENFLELFYEITNRGSYMQSILCLWFRAS